MSRLSDAWAALCGRPRVVKEMVYLPGEASLVEVFMGEGVRTVGTYSYPSKFYYATCAQAHAERGGHIVKVSAIKFADGDLYQMPQGFGLNRISLEPKPKRAKGAKA